MIFSIQIDFCGRHRAFVERRRGQVVDHASQFIAATDSEFKELMVCRKMSSNRVKMNLRMNKNDDKTMF